VVKEYFECRFSGSGGQGIMLIGYILSVAAGVYEEKNVVQTRSYGPEARGSACKTEVIVSLDPIDYLQVTQPDFLLALTQESFDKYNNDLKENGLVLIDPNYVQPTGLSSKNIKVCKVPLIKIAMSQAGSAVAANVVSLGVMGALTGVVCEKSLEKAVRDTSPYGTVDSNLQALAAGYEVALKDDMAGYYKKEDSHC